MFFYRCVVCMLWNYYRYDLWYNITVKKDDSIWCFFLLHLVLENKHYIQISDSISIIRIVHPIPFFFHYTRALYDHPVIWFNLILCLISVIASFFHRHDNSPSPRACKHASMVAHKTPFWSHLPAQSQCMHSTRLCHLVVVSSYFRSKALVSITTWLPGSHPHDTRSWVSSRRKIIREWMSHSRVSLVLA